MTVKELIEQLSKLNPETRVFVRGYEAGYDDINCIEETQMILNVNSVWYYGKHETLENEQKTGAVLNKTKPSIEGIIISYDEKNNSTR